jgi:hypothetical protein
VDALVRGRGPRADAAMGSMWKLIGNVMRNNVQVALNRPAFVRASALFRDPAVASWSRRRRALLHPDGILRSVGGDPRDRRGSPRGPDGELALMGMRAARPSGAYGSFEAGARPCRSSPK